MKLGLGTAQFGQGDYGVARTAAPLDAAGIEAILQLAGSRGVDLIDTAPAYGDAETLLGRLLPANAPFRLVTKTRVFRRPIESTDGAIVRDDLHRSLDRLRRERLNGLLVHDADDLLQDGGGHIFEALQALKEQDRVNGIGVSVYDGEQLDRVLDRFPVDLVQAPLNLLDQRLVHSGHLEKMKQRGIEIHVRSLFLQGLLLMDADRLPARFAPLRQHLLRCDALARGLGLTLLQTAVAYVAGVAEVDVAVCGTDSPAQLDEICAALRTADPRRSIDWSACRLDDPHVLDPRRWQEQRA